MSLFLLLYDGNFSHDFTLKDNQLFFSAQTGTYFLNFEGSNITNLLQFGVWVTGIDADNSSGNDRMPENVTRT